LQLIDRGLDLLSSSDPTPEELERFRDYYRGAKGHTLPALDFWMRHRPEVAKRHRLLCIARGSEGAENYPLRGLLAALHYYTIIGYEDGIRYEIRHSRTLGATKGHILDTLAIAYMHASQHGMSYAATPAQEYLADDVDVDVERNDQAFPPGWSSKPDALATGLDYSTPSLEAGELERVENWYVRTIGEVPRHVAFLGRWRPALLKAHRNRYEHAIRGGLPTQMLPYLMLHLNVIRGFAGGIREAASIGKALGVTDTQIVDAICTAIPWAGPDAISIAAEATDGILMGPHELTREQVVGPRAVQLPRVE
jgi:hypothetical protein